MSQPLPKIAAEPITNRLTPQEAAASVRAVLRMFELWQITDTQARVILGEPSKATFYRWKAGEIKSVPTDTAYRTGDLLGIHKALGYLFKEATRRYEWIKKANSAFGGQSALDVMLAGPPSAVTRVRTYLDSARGGW